ncbi:lipase 1-like [Culicoides brevitarsis]|uniref:lipase 1-like n=1 Tax=Culicoides brevitarsis TaxID=469753 RepID=UPI00307CBC4B
MLLKQILSLALTFASVSIPEKDYSNRDFLENLIEKQGYHVKKYLVTTSDGYQLSLHRIRSSKYTKSPVLLLHGLQASGAQWVLNGNKSLAFMLSRAGYDVWLLNNRGTTLSSGHKTLSYHDPKYWDFSFHEIGIYDLPAAIDLILHATRRNGLHFIGHSQGCSSILVTATQRPAYQRKIISAYFLNPGVYYRHISADWNNTFHALSEVLRETKNPALMTRNTLLAKVVAKSCNGPFLGNLCTSYFMQSLGGDNHEAANPQNLISIYAKYIFNNAGWKQFDHYKQLFDAGRFQMYDYGPKINYRIYGSSQPLEYDLSEVYFPISLMYGTLDTLTPAADIKSLIPEIRNLKGVIGLPWNHMDLVHSKNADKWLHRPIIDSLNDNNFH